MGIIKKIICYKIRKGIILLNKKRQQVVGIRGKALNYKRAKETTIKSGDNNILFIYKKKRKGILLLSKKRQQVLLIRSKALNY